MKRLRIILVLACLLPVMSCENVFHNDKLDFLWRLDSVEYLDGKDFSGKPCNKENKSGLWFGFSRDLVEIENQNSEFKAVGILKDSGDLLVFDFSMYSDWTVIMDGLRMMGMDTLVSTFQVTELNRKNMILTGNKTVLELTRW